MEPGSHSAAAQLTVCRTCGKFYIETDQDRDICGPGFCSQQCRIEYSDELDLDRIMQDPGIWINLRGFRDYVLWGDDDV